MPVINVGYDNSINTDKLMSIIVYKSSPSRRIRENAIDNDKYIDATEGNRTRSLIILSEGFVVGSAVASNTLKERINNE